MAISDTPARFQLDFVNFRSKMTANEARGLEPQNTLVVDSIISSLIISLWAGFTSILEVGRIKAGKTKA